MYDMEISFKKLHGESNECFYWRIHTFLQYVTDLDLPSAKPFVSYCTRKGVVRFSSDASIIDLRKCAAGLDYQIKSV